MRRAWTSLQSVVKVRIFNFSNYILFQSNPKQTHWSARCFLLSERKRVCLLVELLWRAGWLDGWMDLGKSQVASARELIETDRG
jgi:hypothetical protein